MSKLPAFLFIVGAIIGTIGFTGNASARAAGTIETSADTHNNKFFGEGVLRVIVTDPNADNNGSIEEIGVDITADPASGSSSSKTFFVPETSDSSSTFEFFLAHANATAVGPEDLDPINSAGVVGDGNCVAHCAPFITFGPGGDIDIDSGLYDKVTFEIMAADAEVRVSYDETAGTLKLDRDSYGTDSFVYISIVDEDANLNPTKRDEFIVDPDNDPNGDLLVLSGGTMEDAVVFKETGDTSAVFEGTYKLGQSILVSSKSLMLTLHEKANYDATLSAPENDSNEVDEISFTVGNSNGSIGEQQTTQPTWDPIIETDKKSYSIGEIVNATITDKDADAKSATLDSIQLQVLSGSNKIGISAIETGVDTGLFQANFQLAEKTSQMSNEIAAGRLVTIVYTDKRPADYAASIQAGQDPEKDFTHDIDVQLPFKSGIEATNVTAPVIKAANGGFLLSSTISNNNDKLQPFVALIEVRDNSGVTVFLALRTGTLNPISSTNIGVVWQPDHDGEFEIRILAITSIIGEADLLSLPAVSDITITSTT